MLLERLNGFVGLLGRLDLVLKVSIPLKEFLHHHLGNHKTLLKVFFGYLVEIPLQDVVIGHQLLIS